MIELKDVNQIIDRHHDCFKVSRRNGKTRYSDNIYTFDIEVSSLFKINGTWRNFDYSIKDYSDIDIASCVYICMIGVNDNVYYFRNFEFFEDVLKHIADEETRKIIYVHNLAYEFHFLRMFLKNYTIENMLATAPHKPISFYIKELNIEFRCSYKLTNLSLEKSAENYTDVRKKTGDLDYNITRSPLTKLNDVELGYCEYDIITLTKIIQYFKSEYGHIFNIPLTQTGEVRRDLLSRLDYFYIKKQQELIPPFEIYMLLMQAFAGGITHSNIIYTNQTLKNVYSADETSAYPTMLLTKKYPVGRWVGGYDIDDYNILKDDKCFLFHVKLYDVKSKLYNHYLSSYKGITQQGVYADNGRIVKCDYIELVITDCDYEMILQSYDFSRIEYVNIYGCNKRYLDKRILNYLLELYKQKTELKGVDNELYMKSKQRLNSCFGMLATNVLNQDTYYKNNEWGKYNEEEIKETFMREKIDGLHSSYSLIGQYAWGVWCTAYNRSTLWGQIIKNDNIVCYYDTDSIKSVKPIDFTEYNNYIINECKKSAEENGLDYNAFCPVDRKGKKYHIGIFDTETTAQEFKTLGAKKYVARYEDGLHLTVAGVSKLAVSALNDDIENFKKETVFDYEHARKNIHFYVDEQAPFTFTDCDGNEYTCNDSYGIVLQPTTYKLGLTTMYEQLINEYEEELNNNDERTSD